MMWRVVAVCLLLVSGASAQQYDPYYPPPGAVMPVPPNQGGYGPPPRGAPLAPIQRRPPLNCEHPRDAYDAFICFGGHQRPMCQLMDGRVAPCD